MSENNKFLRKTFKVYKAYVYLLRALYIFAQSPQPVWQPSLLRLLSKIAKRYLKTSKSKKKRRPQVYYEQPYITAFLEITGLSDLFATVVLLKRLKKLQSISPSNILLTYLFYYHQSTIEGSDNKTSPLYVAYYKPLWNFVQLVFSHTAINFSLLRGYRMLGRHLSKITRMNRSRMRYRYRSIITYLDRRYFRHRRLQKYLQGTIALEQRALRLRRKRYETLFRAQYAKSTVPYIRWQQLYRIQQATHKYLFEQISSNVGCRILNVSFNFPIKHDVKNKKILSYKKKRFLSAQLQRQWRQFQLKVLKLNLFQSVTNRHNNIIRFRQKKSYTLVYNFHRTSLWPKVELYPQRYEMQSYQSMRLPSYSRIRRYLSRIFFVKKYRRWQATLFLRPNPEIQANAGQHPLAGFIFSIYQPEQFFAGPFKKRPFDLTKQLSRYYVPTSDAEDLWRHFFKTNPHRKLDHALFDYIFIAEFLYVRLMYYGEKTASQQSLLSMVQYLKQFLCQHLIEFIEHFLVTGFPVFFELVRVKQSNREHDFPAPLRVRTFRSFMLKKFITKFRKRHHVTGFFSAFVSEILAWQTDPTLSFLFQYFEEYYDIGTDTRFLAHFRWNHN